MRALSCGILLAGLIAGCGGDKNSTGTIVTVSPNPPPVPKSQPDASPAPPEKSEAEHEATDAAEAAADMALEATNAQLERAAKRQDRAAVVKAERRLDRLAARRPGEPSTAADPFVRFVDDVQYKRAPLYVQQTVSEGASHILFVSVFREQFCLKTPRARIAAVDAFFGPADAALHKEGVDDAVVYIVPLLEPSLPERRDALAIGRSDTPTKLTAAGRAC